jgi:hypothetical protein
LIKAMGVVYLLQALATKKRSYLHPKAHLSCIQTMR